MDIKKRLREMLLYENSVKNDERINIYRDNEYIVVRPLNERASCKYGAYTKWCISAPSSGAWDTNPNAIVIMIIQRNYKIDSKRENLIQKFLEYKNNEEEGIESPELTNTIEKTLDEYDNHIFEDLSKIALIFGSNNVEIWDANNIPLNDNYQFGWETLPISDNVISAIENYISNL
jgi:hypothetical protein